MSPTDPSNMNLIKYASQKLLSKTKFQYLPIRPSAHVKHEPARASEMRPIVRRKSNFAKIRNFGFVEIQIFVAGRPPQRQITAQYDGY